jgi:hypothetical protein
LTSFTHRTACGPVQGPGAGTQVLQQGKLHFHGIVGVAILPQRQAASKRIEQLQIALQDAQRGLIALLEGGQKAGMGGQVPPYHDDRLYVPGNAVDDAARQRSRIAPAGVWRDAGHCAFEGGAEGAAELLYFPDRLFCSPGIPAGGKAPRAYVHIEAPSYQKS